MLGILYRKEMRYFFYNPFGYVLMGLFSLIVGWMFLYQLDYFISTVQKLPLNLRSEYDFVNHVIAKLFSNLNFLFIFIVPILTMRVFTEEFKEGTIDILYASSLSDFEIVCAKYLGVLSQGLFLVFITFLYPMLLGQVEISDLSFIFSGYLGVCLNLASYIAVAVLASSFSKNYVVSTITSFVFILLMWMVGWFAQLATGYFSSVILNFISVNYHFTNLLQAHFSLADVSFYLTFIFFMIFLTKKRLESRMW